MTAIEFRKKGEYRNALAEILGNEVLQQAIAIITADDIGKDANLDAPEVVSVRVLSQRVGREQAFSILQELALPLPAAQRPPIETFGTPHTIEEFDQPLPSEHA